MLKISVKQGPSWEIHYLSQLINKFTVLNELVPSPSPPVQLLLLSQELYTTTYPDALKFGAHTSIPNIED
jgi:hypothetical protein